MRSSILESNIQLAQFQLSYLELQDLVLVEKINCADRCMYVLVKRWKKSLHILGQILQSAG
jgi:hypothetical protein